MTPRNDATAPADDGCARSIEGHFDATAQRFRATLTARNGLAPPARQADPMRPTLAQWCVVASVGGVLACGGEEGAPATWTVDFEHAGAALLSVWVDDEGAYAVGVDDGTGPIVLQRRSDGWYPTDTGMTGDLWWVTADGTDRLLVCGADGLVLGYDRRSGIFEAVASPTAHTLYGVWAASSGKAWAVGGDVWATSERGVVLVRGPGGAWEADATFPADVLAEGVMFKVWGTGDEDVWVVGEGGTVLRFDGSAWQAVAAPTEDRLVTIHGTPGVGPYAVGGLANGTLLELDGPAMEDRTPEHVAALMGVFVADEAWAVAVGIRGLVVERQEGEWIELTESPTGADLHAVAAWRGEAFAVGGALLSPNLDRGTILRFGP
jgi:hypothetical protein